MVAKKTSIEFIINCIMLLIWFVIVIELGNTIFTDAEGKIAIDVCIHLKFKKISIFSTVYILKFS
jgi:hypothetical protein